MLLQWKSIVGKTVKSTDETTACNVVTLKFTDGTSAVVDTDAVIGGQLYRPVLYTEEDYKPKPKS